jgi:hypothetical protein
MEGDEGMVLNKTILLNSLSQKVSMPVGMTWGVPWKEGELRRDEALRLTRTEDGTAVPMQHWATAYWPDGSVKWTAHAAAETEGGADAYSLTKGESTSPSQQMIVTQTDETILLDTGVMVLTLGRSGSQWLRSITRGGADICCEGELLGLK